MTNKVTIVFITHNSGHLINSMLSDLDGYEVLIYDNASKDETVSLVQQNYDHVRLVASPTNHGYGRAANKAFKQINSPYALLMNPDVVIKRDQIDALMKMTDQLGDNWLFVAPATGSLPVPFDGKDDTPLPRIKLAEGCALLINLRQHWKLDGFDENFFLFYEETDLCQRALKNKVPMYYADSVSLPHASGESVVPDAGLNNLKRWHYQWSFLYYCKKHHFWLSYYSTVLKNLLIYPIKLLYVDGKSEKYRIYRSRRAATLAFLNGKGAFEENGLPYKPDPLV
jgi:GT2 family glycosyltransferase